MEKVKDLNSLQSLLKNGYRPIKVNKELAKSENLSSKDEKVVREDAKSTETKVDRVDLKHQTSIPSEIAAIGIDALSAEKAARVVSNVAKLGTELIKENRETAKVLNREPHILDEAPILIFIEGFSAFGLSNGDGIREMSEGLPHAKLFNYNDRDDILKHINKHTHNSPLILVGHSFGGDTAYDVTKELFSPQNNFRKVDLLVTLDSVGFNHDIIPPNVEKNLNFFQQGLIPFLHGEANIPVDHSKTEVVNELRDELHSRLDDSREVQFKIYDEIKNVLNPQSSFLIELLEIEST